MSGAPVAEYEHAAGDVTRLVNVSDVDETGVTMIDRRTRFGNPFVTRDAGGKYSREESVERYIEWFDERIEENTLFRRRVRELAGETLGCHCMPKLCHGHVILYYLATGSVPADVRTLQRWRSEHLDVVRFE